MKYLDYVFDGAMGTYFSYKTGQKKSSELANIAQAQDIIDIHKEYLDCGVNAIKTNTFGLNSALVEDSGYRDLLLNKAVDNAKEAVGNRNVNIFANIGPINVNELDNNEYLEIVKVFEKAGLKHFIFETLLEYESVKSTIQYIKKYIKDSVVIVSFGCNQDGYTQLGNYYTNLIEQASVDADFVGLNCICGPTHMYQLIKNIDTTKYNISIMPNAGYPDQDYTTIHNAEYFAQMILKFVSLDVKVIGACCGSTPEHIDKGLKLINKTKIEYIQPTIIRHKVVTSTSSMKEKLLGDRKLIAAEVEPPTTIDTTHLVEAAYKLKSSGADVLTLVDSPLAKTRADSLMIAAKIKNEVEIDVLPHLTCRDKNQIAIKGGLIAANIAGINNVLALSGDAIAKIDRDFNSGVFCFNSINLVNYINELNHDTFFDNPFLIAGALNINATNFEAELKRAKQKINNKVDYLITQSLFSEDAIENLEQANKELAVPIVVGLYPVASYRNALFLNNEVKGITIPDDYIEELKDANPKDYQEISVKYTCAIVDKVYDLCAGFYISTPLKKTDYVCDIIQYIKSLEG